MKCPCLFSGKNEKNISEYNQLKFFARKRAFTVHADCQMSLQDNLLITATHGKITKLAIIGRLNVLLNSILRNLKVVVTEIGIVERLPFVVVPLDGKCPKT